MATKDSDLDRIQLAEAIGGPTWEAYINPGRHPELVELSDPYTDANDDYAVLKWMRNWRFKGVSEHGALQRCFGKRNTMAHYKVGDYARAALKMIRSIASED